VKLQTLRTDGQALIAGTVITVPLAITTPTSNAAGQPLYQFVDRHRGASLERGLVRKLASTADDARWAARRQ